MSHYAEGLNFWHDESCKDVKLEPVSISLFGVMFLNKNVNVSEGASSAVLWFYGNQCFANS